MTKWWVLILTFVHAILFYTMYHSAPINDHCALLDALSAAPHLRTEVGILRLNAIAEMLAILTVFLAASGCDQVTLRSSPKLATTTPAFLIEGPAQFCSEHCCSKAMPYIRAMLSIDPDQPTEEGGCDIDLLFGRHNAEVGEGHRIIEISLNDLLSGQLENPIFPIVVRDDNGHLFLIYGLIESDGQPLYQMVHGGSAVILVSKSDILKSGFARAWMKEDCGDGVPLSVGSGEIRVNEICHNFGEIMPDEELACEFMISNTGDVPIALEKVATSCSCTTTNVVLPALLVAGEELPLEFTVRSSNTASLQTLALLQFREKEADMVRLATLTPSVPK